MEQFKFDLVERKTYTVGELTELVKDMLEGEFPSVWVEGEVSNHGRPASGHHYFTLKDSDAQMRCVMFKQQAMYSRFLPKDGEKFLVHGRMSVYMPRGEYQLIVDRIQPLGVGALEAAFRELKEKLAKEGLFDETRKKPIPVMPRRVGVVTSGTGAAVRDIIRTITSRSRLVDILVAPVKVQGEGAAGQIADAIDLLDGDRNPWGRLDVIIVGRGGGSLEDLWAFNEEIVARAISGCTTPVISAVGHETDFSISDFVADLRAATPTAAAQMVSPRQIELSRGLDESRSRMSVSILGQLEYREERLRGLKRLLPDPRRAIEDRILRVDELGTRIQKHMTTEIRFRSEQLAGLGGRIERAPMMERIERRESGLEETHRRMSSAVASHIERAHGRLGAAGARLGALNPLSVLDRGYSITRKSDGSIVKYAGEVRPGDILNIKVAKGAISAEVSETDDSG